MHVCRFEVCDNDEVVVWRSNQRCGWGSKRKRCEPSATLYRKWLYSREHDDGAWADYGGPYGADESKPREPERCGEVCPPGQHFLERGVKTPCNTRRPRSSWDADYTQCSEMLTHFARVARGGAAQTTRAMGLRGATPTVQSMRGTGKLG